MNPEASSFNPSASVFVPSWVKSETKSEAKQEAGKPMDIPTKSKQKEEKPVKSKPEEQKMEKTKPVEDKEETVEKVQIDLSQLNFHDKREHVNIVFIGHVDSGKSTISGQILCQSGMVEQRIIEKYEREAKTNNRESWYLAFVMDVNEDERAKGKTVEVGKASFFTEKKRYTILDAPGHKSYVPNMISGASQADVGILVISARKGEFETGFDKGGQTREHAMLVKTLGVSKLIVVVNKMDDETVMWRQERFDKIISKLNPFLKTCGFNTKKHVQFIPISGFTGDNIKDKVSADKCDWYEGLSLLDALDELPSIKRDATGPVRFPIMSSYKDKGVTVIMGKVECGTLTTDSELVMMPTGQEISVNELIVEEDEVECAMPGENLCLTTRSVDEEFVHPGFVICSKDDLCQTTTVFDAKIVVLELLDHKPLISKGYSAILHIHSLAIDCEIKNVLLEFSKKTGKPEKKFPKFVKEGSVAAVRITVDQSICLEPFALRPQLGRFTLRDEGKTIAIGKVIKVPILKE